MPDFPIHGLPDGPDRVFPQGKTPAPAFPAYMQIPFQPPLRRILLRAAEKAGYAPATFESSFQVSLAFFRKIRAKIFFLSFFSSPKATTSAR